jgi:hypothetical protein
MSAPTYLVHSNSNENSPDVCVQVNGSEVLMIGPLTYTHIQNEVPVESTFRLLDLPMELQLAIFELAIEDPRSSRMEFNCRESHSSHARSCTDPIPHFTNILTFPPALARVSRSVRHEVLKIYYSQNYFQIFVRHTKHVDFTMWLEQVDPQYHPLVRLAICATGMLQRKSLPTFVDSMMGLLREAGWEPILGRHRYGISLHVAFPARTVQQIRLLNAYK